MPGKKDPEYFPINYNMSGLGSFFGVGRAGSPLLNPAHHHGKFEYDSTNTMSFNVSIPPVNSEEDEETTDDEETSMTGSDIDVDMDTLVLSIRKKLKMSPKFSHHHTATHRHHSRHPSISDDFWTDSPDSDHDDDDDDDRDDNIISNNSDNVSIGIGGVSSVHCSKNSTVSSNNSSNNTSNSSSNNSSNSNVVANVSTTVRRCRNHPYTHSQWRPSNVQSISHIINGRIQKHHHHPQKHWWAKNGKKCSDNNAASVSLLQELITSGSLIKEAVRRINLKQTNCFTSISANTSSSKLSKKFTYNDQECENNITSCYPPIV